MVFKNKNLFGISKENEEFIEKNCFSIILVLNISSMICCLRNMYGDILSENNDMMALRLVCKCGKEFIAFQKRAGETIICKKCGAAVVMPDINNLEDVTYKDVTGQEKIQLKEASTDGQTEKYSSGAGSTAKPSINRPLNKGAGAPEVSAHEDFEDCHNIEEPPSAYKNKKKRVKSFVSASSFMAIFKILLVILLVGVLVYFAPAIWKLFVAFLKNVKF